MSHNPVSHQPASSPAIRRLLPALLLAIGAAVTLSGCVAYPYDYYGAPAYGYAGPVVAPSVVVAPTYGYYGGRGGWYGGWRGRRW